MSRPSAWTRSHARNSGRCSGPYPRREPRSSSPPAIWRRRNAATGWLFCIKAGCSWRGRRGSCALPSRAICSRSVAAIYARRQTRSWQALPVSGRRAAFRGSAAPFLPRSRRRRRPSPESRRRWPPPGWAPRVSSAIPPRLEDVFIERLSQAGKEAHTACQPLRRANLTRRFGVVHGVDRVSFTVDPGEIFGFLGPNGAGKSTTIRMLCGILVAYRRYGLVAGHDVRTAPDKVKAEIGYMSQRFSLYEDLTIRENVAFYAGIYGVERTSIKARVEEILALADLHGRQALLAAELPTGWRQRLAWPAPWFTAPASFFWMNPRPAWIRSHGATSGRRIEAPGRRRHHRPRDDPLHG